MEYAEFVEGVKEGRLRYSIDKNAAGFLYGQVGLIPQGIRRCPSSDKLEPHLI